MASIPLYIGGGLLLYGLYRLWKLIDLLRRRSASASWMLTAGEVYKREVKEYGASKEGNFFMPVISYRYRVMGEEYKNTISLGLELDRDNCEGMLAEVKDNINVHYNPDKPKDHISSEEEVKKKRDIIYIMSILCMSLVFFLIGFFGSPIGPK